MPPGDPYQQPHGGGPGYPGPGFQHSSWQQPMAQPSAPKKRGNGWKWGLGAVALLAVIGVTAAVTLTVAKKGDGGGSPAGTPQSVANGASNSDIASANDTGPVAVITEDPSCAAARPIINTWVSKTKNGWDQRDESIPATAWTPEVRKQYEEAGQAMRVAADQMLPLAKLSPHRVMRELYSQFMAYARAYADSIPSYTPPVDNLARVTNGAADSIANVCAAIDFGSAAARGPLVTRLAEPAEVAPVGDLSQPQRFLTQPNPACGDWDVAVTQFANETVDWRKINPDITAGEWTPEQKSVNEQVLPVMERLASQLNVLGDKSESPLFRDFAQLSVQYRRAIAQALPTYTPADNYLATAAASLSGMVNSACRAVSS